ncbi:hypothetical protein KUTeg_015606 [Tegillarca granosa]|uniref:Uncharacterized protein n=1 Tax=Tegillarca granosa TaxID=220873 RepID=A0ABQ9EQJ7_TEGGR|nr:hypothetical protein KUTeg_015606 [Tegillarca granosa]
MHQNPCARKDRKENNLHNNAQMSHFQKNKKCSYNIHNLKKLLIEGIAHGHSVVQLSVIDSTSNNPEVFPKTGIPLENSILVYRVKTVECWGFPEINTFETSLHSMRSSWLSVPFELLGKCNKYHVVIHLNFGFLIQNCKQMKFYNISRGEYSLWIITTGMSRCRHHRHHSSHVCLSSDEL